MKLHVPAAPLDQLVNVIWLLPAVAAGAAGEQELALPTGTVELVVALDDHPVQIHDPGNPAASRTFRGPLVCGVHRAPFAIDTARPGPVLGVNFKPGGAAAFFTQPLHTLEAQHVALSELAGADARALEDALGGVRDATGVIRVMEAFLAHTLRSQQLHPAVRDAVARLDGAHPQPQIADLVAGSGYSHRRFSELFRTSVGLGAKQFSRVARFQRALRYLERQQQTDWQDLVAHCAFYDQAHLIHEFRRHAGMSPTRYLELRRERLNHPAAG